MPTQRRAQATQILAAAASALIVVVMLGTGSPGYASATYQVTSRGEAYGPGPTQAVTVYRPNASGRRPVAYFIHGGSWTGGSRGQWAIQALDWATHGWVTINIDHTRGSETGDGAKMLADITTVVTKYEAASYIDPARQVMIGDSSGGHLGSTVAAKMRGHYRGVIAWSPVASPKTAADDGASPGATAGQVTLGQLAQKFFGYSSGTTSAFRYVTAYGGPPMWIAGSTDETLLPWLHQGGALCATLGSALCTSRLIPGTDHGLTLRDNHPELQADAYSWAMHRIGAWT